jgi:hypothetical protein
MKGLSLLVLGFRETDAFDYTYVSGAAIGRQASFCSGDSITHTAAKSGNTIVRLHGLFISQRKQCSEGLAYQTDNYLTPFNYLPLPQSFLEQVLPVGCDNSRSGLADACGTAILRRCKNCHLL